MGEIKKGIIMRRSTKRVVGWGSGVAIGVVLILLASVLVIALNSAPVERHVAIDKMVSVEGGQVN